MQDSSDITAITQLIVRERESRDLGFWNRMRECFHLDAKVSISWFQGNGHDFVAASKDMAARGMFAKHRLGPVLVTLNGNRAVATLSGIIDVPTTIADMEFTLSAHCLMLYRTEKRDGTWRLSSFECIYRRDEFVPCILGQAAELPISLLAQFRSSYRNLSYALHLKGYAVNNELPGEDRPDTVRKILQEHFSWAGLPVPD
ncbi:MAG: nuclear transport factor 2 family protein [Pseudomonadota bacterium]